MKKIFIVLLGVMLYGIVRAQYPPITPAWALGHIVWEDMGLGGLWVNILSMGFLCMRLL